MAKYMTLDKYFEVLRIAIPDEYVSTQVGKEWHPEDLASAIGFANEVVGRVLGALRLIWIALAIVVSTLFLAFVVFNAIKAHAAVTFEGMIRSAFIANFSRFGNFDDYQIVVIDDVRGYFVRDGALWTVEIENEEMVKSTARPVDLITVDSDKLKEAMAAVDTLNSDINDLMDGE